MSSSKGPTPRDKLRINPLLVGLSDKEFQKCYKRCTFETYNQGEIIVSIETEGSDVFFVVEGEVRIIDGSDSGLDIVYNDINSGGWFGEVAAIDQQERTATVTALSDTIVAVMPREVFINLILEFRTIALRVLEDFSSYIRNSNKKVSRVGSYTGIQRVYMELLHLAEPNLNNDGTWMISRHLSHKDLADDASTTQDIVARAISQLLKLGLVKREVGSFKILDREKILLLISQQ